MSQIFTDPDVELARPRGGVAIGGWRLHLPKVSGFCGGVLSAIRMVGERVAQPRQGRIWLLGEVIHNPTVNREFRERGVIILSEGEMTRVFDDPVPGDSVVIPAFGIPLELDIRIRQAFAPDQIVDTTCRYVQRIWEFVNQAAREGCTTVIHGKPKHPETLATLSRALTPDNAVLIVPTVEAATHLAGAIHNGTVAADYPASLVIHPAAIDCQRVALVNQTTMLYGETQAIEQLLREAVEARGGTLTAAATVCRATQNRQDAALELCAGSCAVLLVVGGYSSSNTTQLHRLATAAAPAYFITDATAFSRDCIRHYLPAEHREITTQDWLPPEGGDIGLLAGASCPAGDIGDVIRKFRSFAEEVGHEAVGSQHDV